MVHRSETHSTAGQQGKSACLGVGAVWALGNRGAQVASRNGIGSKWKEAWRAEGLPTSSQALPALVSWGSRQAMPAESRVKTARPLGPRPEVQRRGEGQDVGLGWGLC